MSYRNRLSYLTTFSRHAKRVQYYAGGLVHHLRSYDACARETEHLLKALETHPERAELEARAAYYNRLAEPFDASRAPRVSELDRGRSRFYIDLNEHAKGFGSDKRLWYLYGDITKVPDRPTVVKSRPVGPDNRNSVILNLNRIRHFTWSEDPLPFREKKSAAVWRGTPRTRRRRILIEKFYDHPTFDIGHSSEHENSPPMGLPPKGALTHAEQKRFRYFLSLEGNDVATNLKWAMASNMLVMTPALEFETWFMEGALEPGRHFVLLKNNFNDLEDKVAYYDAHPDEAEAIIANAHAWLDRFSDPAKERMIAARVMETYFRLSGQL